MLIRVFRHFVPVSVIVLALLELSLITVIWHLFLSGYSLTAFRPGSIVESLSFKLALVAGIIMTISGLYQNKIFSNYRRLIINLVASFLFLYPLAALGYLYWGDALGPYGSLWELYLKATVSWLICILITRAIFLALTDFKLLKRRVIVLGSGKRADRIAQIERSVRSGYFASMAYLRYEGGSLKLDRDAGVNQSTAAGSEVNLDAISQLARKFRASEVVIATEDRRGLPVHQLLQCRMAGIKVIDYLDFIERETKSVDVLSLYPGWLIFSDGFRGCGPVKFSKRCFDIALSAGLLMFTLPLMVLTSLLIKFDSRGPVLHRQERVGLGGKSFVLLKFRSMIVDAEKNGTPLWAGSKDPRITRIGAIIRKLRIDELPQLINVLRGEMSFVGPRPERPQFVKEFAEKIPFYSERHCVKPGITGWAQTNYPYGASLEDARNKLSYDLYYVKNHGLFLDLIIVVQTIRVVLSGDGAR